MLPWSENGNMVWIPGMWRLPTAFNMETCLQSANYLIFYFRHWCQIRRETSPQPRFRRRKLHCSNNFVKLQVYCTLVYKHILTGKTQCGQLFECLQSSPVAQSCILTIWTNNRKYLSDSINLLILECFRDQKVSF